MTPQLLGEELKQFRESKKISLLDISSMTRISVSLLEAIEAGNFEVLPSTYIRAMIREYAEYIGMESGEILEKLNRLRDSRLGQTEKKAPEEKRVKSAKTFEGITSYLEKHRTKFLRENVVLVALITIAAVSSYLLLRQGSNGSEGAVVAEIPFDRVIHETEASSGGRTALETEPPVALPWRPDSLHLQLEVTDSVWISVTMDGKRTEEYLFPPGWSRSWKAEKEFLVTMGNAGGGTFRLNDVDLGSLGKKGSVVRSVKITEDRIRGQ